MKDLVFELPYPPSLNRYYRHVGAKVLISAGGRRYRRDVARYVQAQMVKPAVPGRLSVELDIHPPSRRRSDLDNLNKGLLDAIKHAGVYEDDSLIDRLLLTRRGVVRGGKVVVRISLWVSGEVM